MNTNKIGAKEINLKDFLGYLLSKWVILVIFLIIGTLCLGLYSYVKSRNTDGVKIVTQADVNRSKAKLSQEQIEQVDYLYSQYVSYKAYRQAVQDYIADSLYSPDDEDKVSRTTLYFVESDIDNVNQCFTRGTVGNDEFEEIAEILGKDSAFLDDIYRRITISDLSYDYKNYNGTDYLIQGSGEKDRKKNILQVYVVAPDEDKADAVTEAIEAAFDRELEILRQVDKDIEIITAGTQYSDNVQGFINNRQTDAINSLNNATNQLNNLQTSYIDKLSTDEKAYYNNLKALDEQVIVEPEKSSPKIDKKLAIIGAVIGLVLAIIIIFLKYVFSGRIRICGDVSNRYNVEAPYMVYRRKKPFRIFGTWIRKLRGVDLSDVAIRQQMVASDIGIKMGKLELEKAYMVCDGKTEWEKQVADGLREGLADKDNSVELEIGNPIASPEELEKFSKAEAVLVMAQIDETRQNTVDKWMQLANRYDLNVIGAVMLQES